MLVLSRKAEETIAIGENIVITILRVQGQAVRIGIEAPQDVRVRRGELSPTPPTVANEVAAATIAVPLRDARPRDRSVNNQSMHRKREVRATSPAFRPGLVVSNTRSLPRLSTAAIA